MSNPRLKNQTTKISYIGNANVATPEFLLIWGHRNLDQNDRYLPLNPQSNLTQLTAYLPYLLPAFNTGLSALSYMQNLGFRVNFGSSDQLLFNAPNTISLNTDGTINLIWNTAPVNYNVLLNANIKIAISQEQTLAQGEVLKAEYTANSIDAETNKCTAKSVNSSVTVNADVLVVSSSSYKLIVKTNGLGAFNTIDNINVIYTISNSLPDPKRSDQIAILVYRAFNSINGNFPSNVQASAPMVYISYLNPQDTGDSPNANPVSLGVPSLVENLPNGNIGLYWNSIPDNFGYVPNTQIGNSAITQGNVSGVVVGYLNPKQSGGAGVEVIKPVSGILNNLVETSIVLDATQSIFITSKGKQRYGYANFIYKINTTEDYNNPNYANYFAYIASPAGNPNTVFTIGCIASDTNINATSLIKTNNSNVVQSWYQYTAKAGQYNMSPAEISASIIAKVACNKAPFNVLDGATLNDWSAPSSINSYPSTLDADIAINSGWSPVLVNQAGTPYMARCLSGRLYIPGSADVPDIEWYDITVQQIIKSWTEQLILLSKLPQFNNIKKSPIARSAFIDQMVASAYNFQNSGMFINMDVVNSQGVTPISTFTIIDDTQNPQNWIAQTQIVIAPILLNINFEINVNSYLNSIGE